MRIPFFSQARFPLVTLRFVVRMLAVAGLLAATGCATLSVAPPKPVTVGDVLHMTDDGIPPGEIIDRMRDSGTVYRLDASQLAHLKEQGVADPVINYMQRTYLDAVRRHQALADDQYWTFADDGYWYGGLPFGWGEDEIYPDEGIYSEDEDFDHDTGRGTEPDRDRR